MARIQILELPDSLDDLRPFALVIDQAQDLLDENLGYDPIAAFKAACGARAVLVTTATIDVR